MESKILSHPVPDSWIPKSDLLAGKQILVTGAGDGIGRVIARSCAAHGATLILLGRTQSKLEAVYDDIIASGAPQPYLFPMDLETASQEDYQQLAAAMENEVGTLDGLVLNAAILGQRAPIATYKPDVWDKVMQVNVNAQFYLIRHLLPFVEQSVQGRVLLTSSTVGRQGRAYWGAYSVSKFAVEGLMQVLADELENTSNIRVNSINPGRTRTEMRATAYPGEDPQTVKGPEELVRLYLYLLSSDSQSIHGQMIDF